MPQDLFITQDETLQHLVPFLNTLSKDTLIYDPCCGTKAIGNFLRRLGYNNIIETDLYTTEVKTDYLKVKDPYHKLKVANIPFCDKQRFFKKAFSTGQ